MGKNITNRSGPLESELGTMHPLISWRSVLAGLLIAFFSMIGLLGLGMAFGGIGLDDETSAGGAGIFTAVWFLISSLISIFLGSYFAARVSKFQTGRIGSAQGLVIASLFLSFFLYQTVSAIGTAGSLLGHGISSTAGAVGQGMQNAAQNPAITNTVNSMVEDNLADLNLKSDPRTVASGVVGRLVTGNLEGAKNYLARQAGIAPTQADQRIAQLQSQVEQFTEQARQGVATALKSVGRSLFFLVLLGAMASIGGGALGSVTNFRKPLSREQYVLKNQHA